MDEQPESMKNFLAYLLKGLGARSPLSEFLTIGD
jgi:hypothetical protein